MSLTRQAIYPIDFKYRISYKRYARILEEKKKEQTSEQQPWQIDSITAYQL